MRHNSTRPRVARAAIVAGLSIALIGASTPMVAYATPESDLAAARSRLEQIGAEYQQLQGSLDEMAADLQETGAQIESTSAKLDESRSALSRMTSANYKTGGSTLAKVVFGSSSLEELISSIRYATKVSDAETRAINEVKALQEKLEREQGEQQRAMSDAEERLARVAENQQAAASLVNSLDAEVRAKLEDEARANASIQSGMQSAQDAQDESAVSPSPAPGGGSGSSGGQQGGGSGSQGNSGGSGNGGDTGNGGNGGSGGGGGNGGSGGGSGSGSGGGTVNRPSSVGSSALAIALRYEGSEYVYGGADPSVGFDCSGLVMYAYGQLGISLPHSAGAQMSIVQSRGRWTTDPSQLQYGDLVFFPGHVAFYVGNGYAFGARRPGVPASSCQMKYLGTFLGGGQL